MLRSLLPNMDFNKNKEELEGWGGSNEALFQSIADWGQKTFAKKAGSCTASGFKTTDKNCCAEGYHPYTLFSACACWKNGKKWLKKNPDYVTPDCDGDAAEDASTSSP